MSFNTATLINQLLVGLRNKTETKQLEFIPYTLGPPADTTNKLYSVNGLLYYNNNLLAIPNQSTCQSVNFQPPDLNGNVNLKIFQNGLTSLSTIYTTDVNTSSGISGFTSLNQQIYSIQNELDTLTVTALTNLQNQVNTNTTNISTLTTDVNSLNTQFSNLTTQVNNNTSSISLLSVATYNLEQNKLNVSASSQLLTGNLNINGSVSSTSLINALDFSTPQINSLNTSLSNLTTQVNSNTSSISNLNTQVSQINLNISGLSLLESKTQNINALTNSNITYCDDIWLFIDSSNNPTVGIQPEGTPLYPNTKLIVNGGILTDYVNTPFILSDNFKVQNFSQTTTFLQASTTTNSIIANEIIFTPTDGQINAYTFSLGQGSVQKLNVNVDNTIIQNGITSKSGINISGISNLNVVNANSLNVSGISNLKDLNVNGNLNVYGGSFTSQSVINQFTSMSIIMNPAGSVPGLSVTQGGGTNAIFEVVDSDSNIKFQINQDCDLSINNGHFLVDSATGDLTTLGGIQTSGNVVVGSGQNKIQLRQNTGVIDCVDIYSATFPSGLNTAISLKQTSSSILTTISSQTPTIGNYLRGNGTAFVSNTIQASDLPVLNNKTYYVSLTGNDSNNGLSPSTPVLTLSRACTLAGGNGNAIIVFPGVYTETTSLNNHNLTISSANSEAGGIVSFTGAITVNNPSSSVRILGISFNTLIHSGAGSLYLQNCIVNVNLSSSGSGYLSITNCNTQGNAFSGAISITGAKTVNINSDNLVGFLNINNASASVVISGALQCAPITVTAGVLSAGGNCVIYSAGLTLNAITASAGTTVSLDDVTLLTPSNTLARMAISGNLSLRKVFFDKTNSTLGTRLAQALVTDSIDVNNLTSATSALGNASSTQITNSNNINTGALCINKVSPSTGSVVDLSTANSSMILPRGTTAEQPTPISGMIRYNTTTNAFEGASGSGPTWQSLGGSGGIQNAYSTITANNIGFSAIGEDNFTFDAGSGISFDTSGDKTCIISNNRNQWNNIAISGQTTLNPTSTATTLNLVAGTGMSILTNNSTKSITFNASGGGSFNPTINNVALYDMLSYNDNIWTNLVPLRNVPTFTVSGNTATLASVNHVFNISSSTYDWQLSTNSNFNSPIIDDNTASPTRDFTNFVTGGVLYYVRIRIVSNWLSKKTQWFSSSFTAVGLPLNWTNRTPENTLTVTGWLSDGSWNSITQNPNTFVGVDVNNNNSSGSSRPPVSVNPWYSNGNTVINGSLTENNMTLMVNNTNVNESSYLSISNSALGYGCIIFDLGSTFFLSSGCIIRAVYNIAGGWGNISYANGLCVEYYDTITGWVEVGQYPTISQVSEMQNFYTLSFGGAYQSRFWRVRNKTSLYTGISGFRLLN